MEVKDGVAVERSKSGGAKIELTTRLFLSRDLGRCGLARAQQRKALTIFSLSEQFHDQVT